MNNPGIERLSDEAINIIETYADFDISQHEDFSQAFVKIFLGIKEMDRIIREQRRVMEEMSDMISGVLIKADKGESVYD